MSNPTPVINFADSLAQFLARTNQFGEPNQDLVQQKFNKKEADGSSNPVFAALESRSRAVAQWANMVDDFIVQFFTDQIAAGGGETIYPPFNMSMATNAARFLPWGSENAEGSGITFGTRFIVPFDATITGFVVRSSGSLIPGVCTFQITDAAEVAIGPPGSVDVVANDVVYQTGAMSVDIDANTTIGVDFDPTTSPSGEVMGHMIVGPR